jgi:glycosyltransferase involved in cell wall biosynthesis
MVKTGIERAKLNSLSVVFPCYNEEKNVSKLIESAVKVIPTVAEKYELIIVNDGSKDNTSKVAHKLASKYDSVVVVDQNNKGYGGAVKAGFNKARYDWVFFTDSDLQFDLKEITKLVKKSTESKLIIGYRTKRADGFKRALLAYMLKVWNFVFLQFPLYIRDIDCAFKLINKEVLNKVGVISSDGAMFSTEFLLKATKAGYKPIQIGVSHFERKDGSPTGNNKKVILKAVRDTFKLMKDMKLQGAGNRPNIAYKVKPRIVLSE